VNNEPTALCTLVEQLYFWGVQVCKLSGGVIYVVIISGLRSNIIIYLNY